MLKKILRKYRNFITHPLRKRLDELEKINKNLIFLINQTVDIQKVKSVPSVQRVQKQQLDVLDKYMRFLKEIDVDFYLNFGSMLGAIRHRGFVPWDDDLDTAIFYEDFDKILKHQDVLEKYGLALSSPVGKKETYILRGWHKIYDVKTQHHVSLFLMDIVRTENPETIYNIRGKYNYKADKIRFKQRYNEISFEAMKTKLLALNQEYFKEMEFQTRQTASKDAYLTTNIFNYKITSITKYAYVYPLQAVDFSVGNKQKAKEQPFIPNQAEKIIQDYYGEDYMSFPQNIFPLHPHNRNKNKTRNRAEDATAKRL